MKKKLRMALCGTAFVLPSLIGVLLFFVVPFGINVIYSFSRSVASFEFVGLKNYRELFASDAFVLSFRNTTLFMFMGILLLLILANAMAMFFDYAVKKRFLFAGLALMGSVVPMIIPTGSVLVFIQKLFGENGVFDSVAWMTTSAASAMLLLIFLWKNAGYCMLVIFTGIHTIPKEVFEAAKLDGANGRRIYIHMILPQIKSFLSFSVIMGIIGIFKTYRESYLLLGEYPHESVYMLQNFLNNNFYSINYQRLTTASIVFTIFLSVLLAAVFIGGNRHDA
ncbi:MAG: sugar ABC transporter permease [Lachnospiraceae bacterium]|nr:sugar ABC transporter permease [Lachnospiraceae bacterium]